MRHLLIQIVHYVSNFHPLEVVGCGSKIQLQVGENLVFIILYISSQTVKKLS